MRRLLAWEKAEGRPLEGGMAELAERDGERALRWQGGERRPRGEWWEAAGGSQRTEGKRKGRADDWRPGNRGGPGLRAVLSAPVPRSF